MSNNKNFQPRREVLIDDLSTFKEWSISLRKFQFQNDLVTYNLKLPEFSPDENQTISNQINRYYNACGCETGSLFMSLTLIITVAAYFISGGKISTLSFYQVLSGTGIVLFAALAGKGIGLFSAHWKLIKLSDSLLGKLKINYSNSQLSSN
jgi:hypothetical protein